MLDSTSASQAALAQAAASGSSADLQAALEDGADPCYQDEDGVSPLMLAAAEGQSGVLRVLLDAGAPWNAFDKRGRCAGEYAMEGNHQEAVAILLEAGVRAELVLGAIERATSRTEELSSSASYLQQRVEYKPGGDGADTLMDAESKAVMMAWEGPLMEAHAQAICSQGGDILNIGFGLGLIDEAIQRRMTRDAGSGQPAVRSHTIVEAHPDVYARMCKDGWTQKPGVKVLFGRWQDVLEELGQFDGIFFDTFSEFYEDLRQFQNLLPKLLRKGGLYSYFNGLAADNPFFHTVYCELCKRELSQLSLEVQFVPLSINVSDPATWQSIQNKYWQLDTYFLPVAEWSED